MARRQAFVARLYRLIGERRIDVLLALPGESPVAAVVAAACPQAVALVST